MTETNTQGANLSDVVNNATAIFTTKEQVILNLPF